MARAVKFSDEVLLTRALTVFREAGYEGASLSKLSEAMGLKRASLYHRFPGGKEALALETLAALKTWIDAQIIGPLKRPGPVRMRLESAAQSIALLYDDGREACLINLFGTVETVPLALREAAQALLSSLVSALAQVLEEAGLTGDEARNRAVLGFIEVQGAVVAARTFRDTAPFQAAMAGWVARLLAEEAAPQNAAPLVPAADMTEAVPAAPAHPKKSADEVRQAVARHLALLSGNSLD